MDSVSKVIINVWSRPMSLVRPKSPPDPLKHFAGDKPGWKLAALFIVVVVPPVVYGATVVLLRLL